MNKHDIEYLYGYNRWANSIILDTVSKLTADELTRDLHSSHRSVRDTLAHIISAEWIWLERWKGVSPTGLLNPTDFPTVESLGTRWAEVEQDYAEFIDGMSDESLATVIKYTNARGEWAYPLVQMWQHVMNHSSYHRGQVVTMSRQLGAAVKPVDLLVYMGINK